MKAKNIFQQALRLTAATVMSASLAACGGGSGAGSVSTGGVYFSHEQLAQEFVSRAYTDAGVVLSLVKVDTQQTGYVVVRDSYGLEAIYIDGWAVGTNIYNYMNAQTWYGVASIGGGLYKDAYGYIYEESASSSKDLAKVAAVKQALDVNASAQNIQAQFGLSADRSQVLARLAVQLKNNPKGSMTDADYDSYAQEIMGSSITDLKSALLKQAHGDSSDVNSLMNKAAATNGVGPEQVNKILSMVIPTAK